MPLRDLSCQSLEARQSPRLPTLTILIPFPPFPWRVQISSGPSLSTASKSYSPSLEALL